MYNIENDNTEKVVRSHKKTSLEDEFMKLLNKGGNSTKNDKIINLFESIPLSLLRYSKFYTSISILTGEFYKDLVVSNEKDKDTPNRISVCKYIEHLYRKRSYKYFTDNVTVYNGMYTVYDRNLSSKGAKMSTIIPHLYEENKKFCFFPDDHTICIICGVKYEETSYISIEFFGLNSKKYIANIRKIMKGKNMISVNYMSIMKFVSNDSSFFTSSVKLLKLDNVIVREDIKTTLINKIRGFLYNRTSIYNKYSLVSSLGILLYGSPGTGKTSMIKAILDYLGNTIANDDTLVILEIHIYALDVSTNAKELNLQINRMNTHARDNRYTGPNSLNIFIIEEIDSVLNISRDEDEGDKNSKIKVLLEFLDGINTINGDSIFIATTNYIDKLDKAIIRDGRFDLKLELGDFGRDECLKMFDKFELDKENDPFCKEVLDMVEIEGTINPARLQNMIIDHLVKLNEDNKV